MEAAGIEPASHPCEGCVLPLYYAPMMTMGSRGGGNRTRLVEHPKLVPHLAATPRCTPRRGIEPLSTPLDKRPATQSPHEADALPRYRSGLSCSSDRRYHLISLKGNTMGVGVEPTHFGLTGRCSYL